jgi:pullulanase
MDVVYNHTNAAGQNDHSVLDKIVPGYYHRLNSDGVIETSSCCPNTASEHTMMEKLMIDSLVTWAGEYKVDGFRFDLMGHHMLANMIHARDALTAVSPDIYLYGEAWNFGEVANNARGVNAIQANLGGSGIGSFNDRIRDGVRGGGPFSGLQDQGFITGLFYDPNGTGQGTPAEQEDRLKQEADWIRVSLAGGLAGYTLIDRFGNTVTADQIDYNGQPAGYTDDPQEIINYIAAHDNETLFDAVQLKVPVATSMADRVRVQNLGISIVTLGQGVPFVHAGMDMLRSKSMDRDSYNSGDWFNRLDFSYAADNWGVGLPVASKNQSNWPIMQPLLANPALEPDGSHIEATAAHMREMLAIRKSSPLFRLRTEAEVSAQLEFLNTGPSQIPGLIVMALHDPGRALDAGRAADPSQGDIVVLFNATDDPQVFTAASYAGHHFALHPVQQASTDPVVQTSTYERATGTFSVPARTTAVFVTIAPGFVATQSKDTLNEPVDSATITLVLDTEPSAPVTIALSSLDLTECTVAASEMTLDSSNWDVGVTVTVNVVADNQIDGDQPCVIQTDPDTLTSAAGYNGLDPPDFSFTVIDDGVPVILQGLSIE